MTPPTIGPTRLGLLVGEDFSFVVALVLLGFAARGVADRDDEVDDAVEEGELEVDDVDDEDVVVVVEELVAEDVGGLVAWDGVAFGVTVDVVEGDVELSDVGATSR